MIEETTIKPVIGKLLFVHELMLAEIHKIEFFFNIENAEDYLNINLKSASHGFEITTYKFVDPADKKYKILPSFLKKSVKDFIQNGHKNVYPQMIVSHPE